MVMSYRKKTRSLVLKNFLDHVPKHGKDLKELRESRFTSFCRLLYVNPEAPDMAKKLIFRISISSLGS